MPLCPVRASHLGAENRYILGARPRVQLWPDFSPALSLRDGGRGSQLVLNLLFVNLFSFFFPPGDKQPLEKPLLERNQSFNGSHLSDVSCCPAPRVLLSRLSRGRWGDLSPGFWVPFVRGHA